tara:strand:- start:11387 stop:12277 length:891 start_codon:yes stop_codon:yes gene_type:complete
MKYPIYIVSKKRADTRLTVKTLEAMNTPYRIVIEESDFKDYARVIDEKKILILDPQYQKDYDTCDDYGDSKPKGSGAARNFAWDHSISEGHSSHWCLDDNIQYFYRLHNNLKIRVANEVCFTVMEDFIDRYVNVGMAGPNYHYFAARKKKGIPPYVLNTKVYSCNLIRNHLPIRWRGRYNEDVDLSLRILKMGYATVQFNAFLQGKIPTGNKMKGGNTDTVYKENPLRIEQTKMLTELHPDVVRMTWKFNRVHHEVDYKPFKDTRLIRDPNIVIPKGINNYGMELREKPVSILRHE